MNEEFNGGPKNKWSRIYRKKWFFPAVYLTIAALLVSVVVWYQNMDNQIPDATQNQDETAETNTVPGGEAEPVLDQQELIEMPVQDQDQAEIVTKFFDYNAEQEDRENALVLYNNRFYQSTGVDIASADAESFDVIASLSGTVEEVKEDPLLGNVVVLSHENEVKTYYASLEEVSVTAGSELKQGDKVGTAGKNLFGKDNGTHVHFEIRKDGKEVDPEGYFNQPVSSLQEISEEEAVNEETNATEETEAGNEEDQTEESDEPVNETEEDQAENPDKANESEEGSEENPEDEGPSVDDADETEEDLNPETDDSLESPDAP